MRWNGSAWVPIATVAANGTSYADTGLQAGTTYNHAVFAQNSAGTICASGYTIANTY